jgi:HAD superfamily hydrolase (TIGR01509 family)
VKAVLLDMDGVMVDSEHQWKILEVPFLTGLLGRWTDADHERIVGLSVVNLYGFLAREYGLKLTREEFLKRSESQALEVYRERVSLADGLVDTLEDLRNNGVALGVASSSHRRWIQIVLERFKIGGYFTSVVSGDDVNGRTKPHPDIYLKAAAGAGAEPSRCLAVEDSCIGLTAAKAAGMKCVAYRSGSNDSQDLSKADLEARHFGELRYESLISRLSLA